MRKVKKPAQSNKKNTKDPRHSWVLLFILAVGVGMIAAKDHSIFDFIAKNDDENAENPPASSTVRESSQKNIATRPRHAGSSQGSPEQKAIKSASSTSSVASSLSDRVNVLVDRGEVQAAADFLEEALKTHPDDTALLMEYGILCVLDLKNPEKGKALFEKIIGLDPTHRSALNELVMLYSDQQYYTGGVEFLANMAQSAEDPAEVEYALARLQSQNGHHTEALEHFEKAKNLADIRDQVLIDLAEASEGANQSDKAVDAYQRAIKIQNEEYERALKENLGAIDFIEDRIYSTKLALARTLISAKRQAEALALLNSLMGHNDDPTYISLKQEASVKF